MGDRSRNNAAAPRGYRGYLQRRRCRFDRRARRGLNAAGQPEDKKLVHAFLAKDKENKPATTFSADVPTIHLIWKGERLEAGDQIRAVWIAEDVGDAAPKETIIGERSVTVYKSDEDGFIALSRPRGR